jgi:hypothetical protein
MLDGKGKGKRVEGGKEVDVRIGVEVMWLLLSGG